MKSFVRSAQDRLHKSEAWKQSAYAFVPYRTHFGELCGFADDIVQGGQGFGMHPHQNMEISTLMLTGSQIHRDSTGGEQTLHPLHLQTMSAGTGIRHSEMNASLTEPYHSYQIWVYPKEKNVMPRYESFAYQPDQAQNRWVLALSPDRRQGSARINQDAWLSLTELEAGQSLDYSLYDPANGVYLHCAGGQVTVDATVLQAGDAIGLTDTLAFSVQAQSQATLVCIEVPMQRGIQL